MSWSLNEVEGLARKAARGSGLSWGLSEEAGKAARWLARKGLPGPEKLAQLLTQNQGAAYDSLCPVEVSAEWHARDGALCPIISGAVLCDHAAQLAAGDPVALGPVSFPILLLPFAAGAASVTGQPVKAAWPGTSVVIGADGALHIDADDTLQSDRTDTVRLSTSTDAPSPNVPEASRYDIPDDTAKVLGAFAHKTYAPETEESRLAGAGAGLTDND